MLQQPSPELLQLKELIKKALEKPDTLTFADVENIDSHLKLLFNPLPPNLTSDECKSFKTIAGLIMGIAAAKYYETEEESFRTAIREFSESNKKDLQNFDALLDKTIKSKRGAMINIVTFLQDAL